MLVIYTCAMKCKKDMERGIRKPSVKELVIVFTEFFLNKQQKRLNATQQINDDKVIALIRIIMFKHDFSDNFLLKK